MHRLIVACAVGVFMLGGGSEASAQVLQQHTAARAFGSGFNQFYDTIEYGSNSVTVGPLSQSEDIGAGRTFAVTGIARSDLNSDRLLKFSATATQRSETSNNSLAWSDAAVSWRDVIYLNGSNPSPPSTIRMRFVVDGSLRITTSSPGTFGVVPESSATLGFRFDPVFSGSGPGAPPGGYMDAGSTVKALLSSYNGNSSSEITGFTTHNGNFGAFSGTFEYDAPYDSTLGGYTWSLTAIARATAKDGSAAAEFGNTVRLTELFGAGGVPLGASDVSFDSGLVFTPVPEPSGLLLAAGLTAAGCSRLRRWRVGHRQAEPGAAADTRPRSC